MKRILVFDLLLIAVCSVAAIFIGTDLDGWWFPIVMGIIILWSFVSLVVKMADRSPVVIRLGHYEWTPRDACRNAATKKAVRRASLRRERSDCFYFPEFPD